MGGVLGGHNPQAYPGPPAPSVRHASLATAYALSEMSPVRGILETKAWLYFMTAAEFYHYEEALR